MTAMDFSTLYPYMLFPLQLRLDVSNDKTLTKVVRQSSPL